MWVKVKVKRDSVVRTKKFLLLCNQFIICIEKLQIFLDLFNVSIQPFEQLINVFQFQNSC